MLAVLAVALAEVVVPRAVPRNSAVPFVVSAPVRPRLVALKRTLRAAPGVSVTTEPCVSIWNCAVPMSSTVFAPALPRTLKFPPIRLRILLPRRLPAALFVPVSSRVSVAVGFRVSFDSVVTVPAPLRIKVPSCTTPGPA